MLLAKGRVTKLIAAYHVGKFIDDYRHYLASKSKQRKCPSVSTIVDDFGLSDDARRMERFYSVLKDLNAKEFAYRASEFVSWNKLKRYITEPLKSRLALEVEYFR
jgi:hypothetical protein